MKIIKLFVIISLSFACNKEARKENMLTNGSNLTSEIQVPPKDCSEEIKMKILLLNKQFEYCLSGAAMTLNNHTIYIGMNIEPLLLDSITTESNIAKSQFMELNVVYLPQIGGSPNNLEENRVINRNAGSSPCSAADLTLYYNKVREIYKDLDMCVRGVR